MQDTNPFRSPRSTRQPHPFHFLAVTLILTAVAAGQILAAEAFNLNRIRRDFQQADLVAIGSVVGTVTYDSSHTVGPIVDGWHRETYTTHSL
jgi:hypothetical protein